MSAPEGTRPHRHFAETTSTNDRAREWAAEGAPHGAYVTADRQTAGRGRLGRRWESPDGANLLLSIVVRRPLPPDRVPLVCLAAAVAIREVAGPGCTIKWPNDVLDAQGRKLAGVLAEAEWSGGLLRAAVLGIGVNVGWVPPDLPNAARLPGDRAVPEVRDAVVEAVLRWIDAPPEAVLAAWRAGSATLGAAVRIGPVSGVAVDVDGQGALLVRTADGVTRVLAGDVEMIAQNPPPTDGIRRG